MAALLVQNGTLKSGDVLAAGSILGKLEQWLMNMVMNQEKGHTGGALGFSEVPTAEMNSNPDGKLLEPLWEKGQ